MDTVTPEPILKINSIFNSSWDIRERETHKIGRNTNKETFSILEMTFVETPPTLCYYLPCKP